jgi:histidine phosphotransferase ChpT
MDELKLAALMCSKVCHDLISPVGALSNGIEVLAEDDDPDMREHAMVLLETSAAQAAAKLKFARLAYGSSGPIGREIDLAEAQSAIVDLHGTGKVEILWDAPSLPVNKDVVKVLVNLAHEAFDMIPRGGTLHVVVDVENGNGQANLTAKGPRAKLADATRAGYAGEINVDDLDARTVVPHISGLLARALGPGIEVHQSEDLIKISFTF